MKHWAKRMLLGVWLIASISTLAKGAGAEFEVRVEDPESLLGERDADFKRTVEAAAEEWAGHLAGEARIDVLVILKPGEGRASCRCPSMVEIGKHGANRLFEPSAIAKLKGREVNTGGQPDVEITVMGAYLKDLWFDPEPEKREAVIPRDKLDALSLFMHEIAHAIGFNGWLDEKTGKPVSDMVSTYDQRVIFEEGRFYFVGLRAMKVYGGPVPLSTETNNYHHVGLKGVEYPEMLVDDLMNGVVFQREDRFSITPLDLAILADAGVELRGGQ